MITDFISTDPIEDLYYLNQILGQGAFAQVKKAIFKDDLSEFAVKIIDKKRVSQQDIKVFLNQCQIMFKLEHPNIVEIYEIYDNSEYFYIVMEYMEGGQLCQPKNIHRCSDENQIVQVIRIITDALDYCHSQQIVHRDIKPQNILWSRNDQQAVLKIADFGFARMIGDANMTTFCGTPLFFAPEILMGQSYNQLVDFWAMGVIAYILLSGKLPFEAQEETLLFKQIKKSKIQFPIQEWKYVSCTGKDFVLKLLERNPKKRYGAQQIRLHPWITSQHTVDLQFKQRKQNLKRLQMGRKIEKMRMIIEKTIIDLQTSGDINMNDEMDDLG